MDVAEVAKWLLAGGGLTALVGGGVETFKSRAARRRLDAEANKLDAETQQELTQRASAVNEMALELLEPMRGRIRELTSEVRTLTHEVQRLERDVDSLTDRLRLAQRLLTEHGVALPPVEEVRP